MFYWGQVHICHCNDDCFYKRRKERHHGRWNTFQKVRVIQSCITHEVWISWEGVKTLLDTGVSISMNRLNEFQKLG